MKCFNLMRGLMPFALALLLADAAAAEPIKIGVGSDAAYAPFFIAHHRGLFKQAGVDATLIRFAQGGDAMDALIAGQVVMSGAAEQTTMIRMTRGDVRPLAIYEQSGTYLKLVARPPIADVMQIKKYGVVKGTVSEYCTFKTLLKFGIDRQSVQTIASGPPELPALLVRGDIDAYFAWEPWPTIGLKQGGRVLHTSGDVGYAYTMWVSVSGAWLDANPAAAKALVAALAEADRQIASDPVKASEDLQAETKLPAADTIGFLKDIQWKLRDFAPADLESFDQIADFMLMQKITTAKVDFRKSLQVGFYKE
jgi:NitT/TauT family transport system substrate-binding protein